MSVQIDNYCTTSFILKDKESVEYIGKFCALLMDKLNLSSGCLSDEAWCDMIEYGSEENAFTIKTGGYMDSGPELRASVLTKSEESENEDEDEEIDYYEDAISLFSEVQKHLKEDTWFFVDQYSWDRVGAYTGVTFYHQDGRYKSIDNFDIKSQILKEFKI
jgi:hypothetical protein